MGNIEHLENEGLFWSLIKNCNEMLTLINEKNEIIYESAAIKSILGFDPEEKIGRPCFANTCPEVLDETKSVFKKAIENPNIPFSLFSKQFKKNGDCIYTEGTVTNMLNNPNVKAIVCNYRDVTPRINAEISIKESEEKYRSFFEQAFDGVFISDKDHYITEVNESGSKMLGYSIEELKKIKFSDLLSEEEKKNNPIKFMELLEGKSVINQRKITRKDGSEILVLINAKMYPDGRFQSLITDITTNKAKDIELIKAEEKFSSLVNTVHGIVWEASIDPFRSTFVSKQAEETLGYSVKRWLEESDFWENHLHPEDKERVLKSYLNFSTDNETNEFEYRMIASDGRIVWFKDIVTTVFENNKPKYLRGIIVDITERKKAEEELKIKESYFKNLIEHSSSAIILIGEDGKFIYQSPVVKKIVGYTIEKESHTNIFQFIHPDEKDEFYSLYENLLKNPGSSVHGEFRFLHQDGHYVWLEGTVTNFLHDTSIKALIANYQDVSERKKTQEELEKSEANLHTIFDNADTGYILMDTNLNMISFNKPAEKFSDEDLHKPLEPKKYAIDYFPEERKAFMLKKMKEALAGNNINHEVKYTQEDGSNRWYFMRFYPVYNLEKKIVGIVMALTDVTERKLYDLQRQKITQELLQRNKAQEQFTYIVSHNLRSPVANIIGVSKLLQEMDLTEEERNEMMQGLVESAKKLDEVIIDLNQILQVKRDLRENKELVLFSNIVNDIKGTIGEWVKNEEVIINTDFKAGNQLFTLKSYLNSIFYNLISNSIKYRKPGITALIEIYSRLEKGKLQLIFKDNGLGIDLEKKKDQVFGLYKRFHTFVEGRGMGLFMVKTQVETLGGKISIASKVNEGTEFIIEFDE
jgi:PAS domain S-box-containing protein